MAFLGQLRPARLSRESVRGGLKVDRVGEAHRRGIVVKVEAHQEKLGRRGGGVPGRVEGVGRHCHAPPS